MITLVSAFVFVTTATGKEKETLEKLLRENPVKEASFVYGDYDIVAKIETETLDELNSFIVKVLRATPNIVNTNTLIALQNKKGS